MASLIPPSLLARTRAYARAHGLIPSQAAVRLIELALDQLDARRRGGKGRWAGTTLDQRRDMLEGARKARWDKSVRAHEPKEESTRNDSKEGETP